MPDRDIIVISASAGGVAAFRTIVSALPPELAATLVLVQHMSPSEPSLLPELLASVSPLEVRQPTDGERIRHGFIYVASPDHHLLLQPEHLRVVRGPKENSFRPAIDATLRSAAQSYEQRVVGVLLTGMLDDGTAGLLTVKQRGGVVVVQDPREPAYPSMPRSACRYVDVVCPVAAIAPRLLQLLVTGETTSDQRRDTSPTTAFFGAPEGKQSRAG